MSVDHYENFPVASILCPRRLRAPITALYGFARTADDLADEGDASAAQRLQDLAAYRADLNAALAGLPVGPRWSGVFRPLAGAVATHRLPAQPLHDLLDAFTQDVERTERGQGFADWADLLDYCRRSANPVGRLLLHLYGVHDAESLAQSDRICTGLQVANFWQDLGRDVARGRFYLPEDRLAFHGITRADLLAGVTTPAIRAVLSESVVWAKVVLEHGAPLARRVPGRAGWELRLVVEGGLRILERIRAVGYDTLNHRPVIGRRDAPLLLWRALWR